MNIAYYFNTLDGRCAAAILSLELNGVYCIPSNFGYHPKWTAMTVGDKIYVLGMMFDFASMEELNKNFTLTFIDHHEKTCIDCANRKFIARYGILDKSVSSAVLTWKYCFDDKPVPKMVTMISDYTLGNFGDEDTVAFWEGLSTLNTAPINTEVWAAIFSDDQEFFARTVERGKIILAYTKKNFERLSNELAYECSFANHKCLAMNYRASSSRAFDSVLESVQDIDILLMYSWLGFRGSYKVTAFANNPDVDLIPIMTSYGGGGQRGVGSFIADELPFKEDKQTFQAKTSKFNEQSYLDSNIIARQAKLKDNRVLFNQGAYYDNINGMNTCIINCPEVSKQIFDSIQLNLPQIDIGILWVWVGLGKYRTIIYSLSNNITEDGLVRFVAGLGYEGGATKIKDGFVIYSPDLKIRKLKRDASQLTTTNKTDQE